MQSNFSNLIFEQNSKAMMRAILQEVPALFRGEVQKRITTWVLQNHVTVVSEQLLFRAVKEIAPPSMAQNILNRLQPLRTK